MSIHDVTLVLALVALVLALVDELQSNGRSLASWAIVALSLIFLWGWFNLG